MGDFYEPYYGFEPEYEEPSHEAVDPEIDYIEAHIDEEILVDENGQWDYTNENSQSTGVDYNERFDVFPSEIYTNLYLSDMASVIENSFTLIEDILPTEPGRYKVVMDVLLAYDVRGVEVYNDSEYNFDETEITFLPQESQIYNAETIKIS